MLRRQGCALGLLSIGLICGKFAAPVSAVPYASQVRDLGGNMREFVLNEAADLITVNRNGANPVTFTAPAAGRYSFDMTGFSSFDIEVSKNAPVGFSIISDPNSLDTKFARPNSLVVNNNPASPYFGTVYVANANPVTTLGANARPTGDGIYALSGDLKGVDLSNNFAVVTNTSDTTQAKAPNFLVAGSSNSPYRITLDDGGNIIIGDWSDANGGIKWASPDLRYGGLLLKTEGGATVGGTPSDVSDEFGPIPLHGSIVSRVYATGSVGNNLVIQAVDEDMDATFSSPPNDYNSLWKWDVGSARTSNKPGEEALTASGQPPTLVVDSKSLGNDPSGTQHYYSNIIGVLTDWTYNPQFNKWYVTMPRSLGSDSSALNILTVGATADTPTVNWSSRDQAITLNLDGNTSATTPAIDDFLRNAGQVSFSPDGQTMYLHKNAQQTDNPILGSTSNLPGTLLAIPLDANGLPIITVNDNGTPSDPTDDRISNWTSVDVFGAANGLARNTGAIAVDAAGNVYVGSNQGNATVQSERIEVYSPGGNKKAITRSNGTFEVQTIVAPPAVPGDYSGNGTVGPEDYTLWASKFGQSVVGAGLVNLNPAKVETVIDASDYTFWRDLLPASAAGAAAVPEPSTAILAIAALLGGLAIHRRK